MEVVKDGENAIQFNANWCAWVEIYKLLGHEEACKCGCHGGDVFFPEFLKPLGITYKRTGMLSKGDACCDFRFERVSHSYS